jgi:hypothetical protein
LEIEEAWKNVKEKGKSKQNKEKKDTEYKNYPHDHISIQDKWEGNTKG